MRDWLCVVNIPNQDYLDRRTNTPFASELGINDISAEAGSQHRVKTSNQADRWRE